MANAFYSTIGVTATGTTSLTVAIPAESGADWAVNPDDFLVLFVVNKYPNNGPSTPAGWSTVANNQASGGAGAAGIDTGTVYVTLFYKIVTQGTTGNVTVTITSGNAALGVIMRFGRQIAETWDTPVCTIGSDNTAGTGVSITGADNLNLLAGDMLLCAAGFNTDTYTYSSVSLSATGATLTLTNGTSGALGTSSGQDCYIYPINNRVTAGPSTAPPVFTATASGSAASAPAGAAVFMKIGFVRAAAFVPQPNKAIIFSQAVNRAANY